MKFICILFNYNEQYRHQAEKIKDFVIFIILSCCLFCSYGLIHHPSDSSYLT
ncbi:hypothetical protein PROFFT_A_06620 [Candidatus Profftia tarda]|uniref:Uncharacterized protein n=1 Tax=Candidatus Profftia tarda TaxID=1177216 RepID=A0A8E4H431_9ENTR|nr:hypothetical protein PROFFT_A_06620 [Candidatus Profftia tarda]